MLYVSIREHKVVQCVFGFLFFCRSKCCVFDQSRYLYRLINFAHFAQLSGKSLTLLASTIKLLAPSKTLWATEYASNRLSLYFVHISSFDSVHISICEEQKSLNTYNAHTTRTHAHAHTYIDLYIFFFYG